MEIKIEKGIQKPANIGRKGQGTYQAAMGEMEVGDSFVHPGNGAAAYAMAAAKSVGGKKFTASKMPDGSMRIWRDK